MQYRPASSVLTALTTSPAASLSATSAPPMGSRSRRTLPDNVNWSVSVMCCCVVSSRNSRTSARGVQPWPLASTRYCPGPGSTTQYFPWSSALLQSTGVPSILITVITAGRIGLPSARRMVPCTTNSASSPAAVTAGRRAQRLGGSVRGLPNKPGRRDVEAHGTGRQGAEPGDPEDVLERGERRQGHLSDVQGDRTQDGRDGGAGGGGSDGPQQRVQAVRRCGLGDRTAPMIRVGMAA